MKTYRSENTTPNHRIGLRAPILFAATILLGFGLLYTCAGTAFGRFLFPASAKGSLLVRDGRTVGSVWVAQPFSSQRYFQSRPSAAHYDPMGAAGSNLARSNPELRKLINDEAAAVAVREGISMANVPDDLVTRSGSGLDPHITPAAAEVQVARIARVRGLDPSAVRTLVRRMTEAPQFGVLGQARVNVLRLNLALDDLRPAPGA